MSGATAMQMQSSSLKEPRVKTPVAGEMRFVNGLPGKFLEVFVATSVLVKIARSISRSAEKNSCVPRVQTRVKWQRPENVRVHHPDWHQFVLGNEFLFLKLLPVWKD